MKRKLFALSAIVAMTLCSCGENQKGKNNDDYENFDSVMANVKFLTEVTITDLRGETTTYPTDFSALDVECFYGFKADGSDAKYVKITQQNPSIEISIPVTSSSATLYGGIKYTLKPDFDKTKKVCLGRGIKVDSHEFYNAGSVVSNPKGYFRSSEFAFAGGDYDLTDEEQLGHFNRLVENSKKPRIICTVTR